MKEKLEWKNERKKERKTLIYIYIYIYINEDRYINK